MGKLKTLTSILKNNKKGLGPAVALHMSKAPFYRIIPDKMFLKIVYKLYLGEKLNLSNPKSFNEKLQWMKLYNRDPRYIVLVDKYNVREFVKNTIGEEYLIPIIGVWDHFKEIPFDKLPNQFVLKCTHDSGSVIVCKDKNKFDRFTAERKLERCLKTNLFWFGREWPYKNVSPKIIAEKYIVDESGNELKDYKIFCFNGEPRLILVCSNRFSPDGLHENFYDTEWNLLDVKRPGHPNTKTPISKPASLNAMLILAKRLAESKPFVRIDFYNINDKIFFGEMTFFPASGFEKFIPEEWDYKLGEWIKMPGKKD